MAGARLVCTGSGRVLKPSFAVRGLKGAGVTLVAQVVTMGLNLLGSVVLARLLSPDDYGVIAVVVSLVGFGALIRDFGMGTASLQERRLTQEQASNLFWMNALLTVTAAGALAACGPFVAAFFGDERLLSLVPAMAVVMLLTGLQTQYQARLAREARFLVLALGTSTAVGVGFLVGIVCALRGAGFWALALQQFAAAVWLLGLYVVTTRWMPSRPTRHAGSGPHLRAGLDYGIANVLGYIAENIDTFMIARQWGTVALGNYNRAFQLFMQPISAVFGPLTQVVIPTLRRLEDEGSAAPVVLLRIQGLLVGPVTWLLLAGAVTADWLVPLLLGDQWSEVAPLLQILAIGGIFKALSQINLWAFIAGRQSRQLLLSGIVTKSFQVVAVLIASLYGVEWVAWAYVVGRGVSWIINLIWLSVIVHYPSKGAFLGGSRFILSALVAFGMGRLVLGLWPQEEAVWMVIIGFTVSSLVFWAVAVALPGGLREARAVWALGRGVSSVVRS